MDKNRRPEQCRSISGLRDRSNAAAASIGETIIGGYVKNGIDQVNLQPCNPLFPPLRLLNLTTYVWQSTYDPADNTSFESHSAVSNVIGGG